MRATIGLLLLATLTGAAPAPAPRMCERVFVGTQQIGDGAGVFTAAFDPANGTLSAPRLAAAAPRTTWLLADRRRLYVVSDPRDPGATSRILAFTVDATSGDLQPLGEARAPGGGPTHLAIDRRSRTLFVAHYGSGEAAALPLASDGAPKPATSVVRDQGTGPSPRQTGPHAHAVVVDPSGRYLLVPDLGADKVFVYRFDPRRQMLTPAATPWFSLPPGNGPRHLVFAPNGAHAYLVSELAGEVRALRWQGDRLTETQVLPLDPPGTTHSGAEIAVAADGRHVYVSNRADDTIVTFAVGRDGALREAGRVAAGGKTPWSFAIDTSGRWMLVTTQGSDAVTVLPIAAATGLPGPAVRTIALAKPVAVTFAGRARGCL